MWSTTHMHVACVAHGRENCTILKSYDGVVSHCYSSWESLKEIAGTSHAGQVVTALSGFSVWVCLYLRIRSLERASHWFQWSTHPGFTVLLLSCSFALSVLTVVCSVLSCSSPLTWFLSTFWTFLCLIHEDTEPGEGKGTVWMELIWTSGIRMCWRLTCVSIWASHCKIFHLLNGCQDCSPIATSFTMSVI